MEYPTKLHSDLLTVEQVTAALQALPSLLLELVGNIEVIARYGFGTGGPLPKGGHGAPISLLASELKRFFEESIQNKILLPGDSDFLVGLSDGRLRILFCHEGHIHLGGTDEKLIHHVVAAEPFKALLHPPKDTNPGTDF